MRSAAIKAEAAAAALLAWLENDARAPGQGRSAPGKPGEVGDDEASRPATRSLAVPAGRAATTGEGCWHSEAAAAVPAHTDWLHHNLTVAGPGGELQVFRTAAAGAGTIPWHLDLDRMLAIARLRR